VGRLEDQRTEHGLPLGHRVGVPMGGQPAGPLIQFTLAGGARRHPAPPRVRRAMRLRHRVAGKAYRIGLPWRHGDGRRCEPRRTVVLDDRHRRGDR
jgi:hypothetical protein